MESWEVLEDAIPRSTSDRVAKFLGVGGSYVRKWRRQPESDEAPTASGQRSILDRICELIDVVFLINPCGSGLIVNHINAHYRELVQTHAKPIVGDAAKAETISELLTQTTEAINHFNLYGCTTDTVRELVEARDAFAKAIECVESTMAAEVSSSEFQVSSSKEYAPIAYTGYPEVIEDMRRDWRNGFSRVGGERPGTSRTQQDSQPDHGGDPSKTQRSVSEPEDGSLSGPEHGGE